jgi:galactose mutarotase-like enzyme
MNVTTKSALEMVKEEELVMLSNKGFSFTASSRGAILRELSIAGQQITRDLVAGETPAGEKGALFCCPIFFARFPGRRVQFAGHEYIMEYPSTIDTAKADPNNNFIHGFEHYYTWDVVDQSKSHVRFELNANRFPSSFPFPHTSIVEYRLEGERDLVISVGIKDCPKPTPAMLTIHPFFKFYLQSGAAAPEFEANLISKFEYPPNAAEPMANEAPVALENSGPFCSYKALPKDLDHSFISSGYSRIKWPNGLELSMVDETSPEVCPIKPLQVWTTGADSRNAFGIEQGGPANLFNLVANHKVPAEWLPVCNQGQTIMRTVRYSSNSNM